MKLLKQINKLFKKCCRSLLKPEGQFLFFILAFAVVSAVVIGVRENMSCGSRDGDDENEGFLGMHWGFPGKKPPTGRWRSEKTSGCGCKK